MARPDTAPAWPANVSMRVASVTLHTLTRPSPPAVTSMRESGVKRTSVTAASWRPAVARSLPVCRSSSRTEPSAPPSASATPVGAERVRKAAAAEAAHRPHRDGVADDRAPVAARGHQLPPASEEADQSGLRTRGDLPCRAEPAPGGGVPAHDVVAARVHHDIRCQHARVRREGDRSEEGARARSELSDVKAEPRGAANRRLRYTCVRPSRTSMKSSPVRASTLPSGL